MMGTDPAQHGRDLNMIKLELRKIDEDFYAWATSTRDPSVTF